MMKILKIFLFSLSVILIFSCEQDRAFIEFDDLEKGAYARLLDGPNGVLDFEDPVNSGIDFTVEFYDENNGQNVESFVWTVEFPGFGPATIASVSKSAFGTSPDGLPGTSISFTYQQVLDALGMTLDDIILGEAYLFNGTITKSDGSVYSVANTGSNVISSSPFSGFFQFRQGIENLPCIHALSGTFDAVVKVTDQGAGIGWDGCGGNEWTGTVIWEAEHDESTFGAGTYNSFTIAEDGSTVNDLSFGAYFGCYGASTALPNGADGTAGTVRVNFDCNKGFFTGASQWGEVYSFSSMSVNGTSLTFAWTNDYGEGAEVTLTRTDGQNWPDDMRI